MSKLETYVKNTCKLASELHGIKHGNTNKK